MKVICPDGEYKQPTYVLLYLLLGACHALSPSENNVIPSMSDVDPHQDIIFASSSTFVSSSCSPTHPFYPKLSLFHHLSHTFLCHPLPPHSSIRYSVLMLWTYPMLGSSTATPIHIGWVRKCSLPDLGDGVQGNKDQILRRKLSREITFPRLLLSLLTTLHFFHLFYPSHCLTSLLTHTTHHSLYRVSFLAWPSKYSRRKERVGKFLWNISRM